jgi:hypothetical protein
VDPLRRANVASTRIASTDGGQTPAMGNVTGDPTAIAWPLPAAKSPAPGAVGGQMVGKT